MKWLLALTLLAYAVADPTLTIAQNVGLIPDLSTLNTVITDPNYAAIYSALNNTSSKLTLFAPNNNAFAIANVNTSNVPLVTDVLLYHVLPAPVPSNALKPIQFFRTTMNDQAYVNLGASVAQVVSVEKFESSNGNAAEVYVNYGIPGALSPSTALVVTADIQASNGYIHIINKVETFPTLISTTAQQAGLYNFLAAVQKAGLASAVDGSASLTVFAPTDAALAAAGWDKLSVSQLTTVLTYHVVPAVAYSINLSNGEVLPTLDGSQKLTVRLGNGEVVIAGTTNQAQVIIPNLLVKNGVIHVIDQVLIPSNL